MSATTAAPSEPALLTIKDIAAMTQRSTVSLARDAVEGRMPAGLKIGRARRWRAAEIRAWIDAGCPARGAWEQMRGHTHAAV
jgi:predicted DNA-binding transcriptional regulator AlpA